MTSNKFKKVLKSAALMGAMAFGLMLSSNTIASAQRDRDYDRDDRYQQYRNDRDRGNTQAAYNRGYSDGVRAGELAARGRSYNSYGYNSYGYNNNGYGGYGNGYMQQAYQNGYNRGYQDGYNRYRNRNRRSGITFRIPW
ncbi:MAG: hypothetical protein JO314_13505 [Acidobacteria bacterium]|nr:hypothetical protein [Acidobacteriota bacterium]